MRDGSECSAGRDGRMALIEQKDGTRAAVDAVEDFPPSASVVV
jgi:hypothetical protein